MRCPKWITAQDLDRWAVTTSAKSKVPELLRRLVLATVARDSLKLINFPSDSEVQRPGYDGTTLTTTATPFVPAGISFWEIGCVERDRRGKAQSDYDSRIAEHKERLAGGETENLKEAAFIAVTPFDWQDAGKWAGERTKDGFFSKVFAYDSNTLEHWIQDAPAVGLWLAREIHGAGRCEGLDNLGNYWDNLQATLRRPLPASVLLVSRISLGNAFSKWLSGSNFDLAIKASSAHEVVAVFCAWVQSLPALEADAISSRSIIVESRETWKALASSQQPLILIASPRLEMDSELSAEAIRQGHHVLRFAEFRTPASVAFVEMPMMRRFDLQEALASAGLPDPEARQLAESAGGNFTILRRRFLRVADRPPEWAREGDLAPVLLAAAWEDERNADQTILSRLAEKKYAEIRALMSKWRQLPDSPIRLVLGTWEFLSPVDAWESLHPFLSVAQISEFGECAVEVLSESNPALELPAQERFMAAIKGKVQIYSPALRRGIAEILALGSTREAESSVGLELQFGAYAGSAIRRILPENCGWERWASLGELLSLLIEAAPEVVLEAVERDISSKNPQLLELMRQESSDTIAGHVYHTGVLWALERAAWGKEYFQRVALCLARLAKIDPGGKSANRPLGSAVSIFFSWRPQTLATIDDRVTALRFLRGKEPEVTWSIIVKLLPKHHESMMDNSKPSYRGWAAGWGGTVNEPDYFKFVSFLTTMAIEMAQENPARWPKLLEHILHMPGDDRERVAKAFEQIIPNSLNSHIRTEIWKEVQKPQFNYLTVRGSKWVSEALSKRLALACDRLRPDDPTVLAVRLFDDDGYDGDRTKTYEEKKDERIRERRIAIREVWTNSGIEGVLQLARQTRQAWAVGAALADELAADAQEMIVPQLLASDEKALSEFSRAFAATMIFKEGAQWAQSQPSAEWQSQQIVKWALAMPFVPETWDWVSSKGEVIESDYWKQTRCWGPAKIDLSARLRAMKSLQAVGRCWSALETLISVPPEKRELTESIICDTLDAILKNPSEREPHTMDSYYVGEAFAFLQSLETINEDRIAALEFGFLPFLDRYQRQAPLTLHRQLATSPDFFVDCLKIIYKSSENSKEESTASDGKDGRSAAQADRVYQLLREWRTIPGSTQKGTLDSGELSEWVKRARTLSQQAGRLAVCDIRIGELFANSGEDNDGAKPLIPIREIIEEIESPDMESGFTVGLCNLRGCYTKGLYEGGKQERDLAATFDKYREICHKWPRTAAVFSSLRDDYIRQANREDERARLRE
jgi:hypothetical protein